MMDYTKLIAKMSPTPDGESPVRHRTGTIDVVNADGTVDLDLGGTVVPDVSTLQRVSVGDVVQVLAWEGDLLVLGGAGPLGVVDYAEVTANQGSITVETTVTGLTFTQALLAGRLYRFTAYMHGSATVTTSGVLRIKDDGVTVLESVMNTVTGVNSIMWLQGLLPGPVASSTWTVTVTPGAGTLTVGATSTRRAFLLLEDIGAT
jgi:hypothetical protein